MPSHLQRLCKKMFERNWSLKSYFRTAGVRLLEMSVFFGGRSQFFFFSNACRAQAIIGLQEVPLAWEGDMFHFFESRKYRFFATFYGYHRNGNMGVALAFPVDLYDVEDLSVEVPAARVADLNRRHLQEQKEQALKESKSWPNFLASKFRWLVQMFPFRPIFEPAWNLVAIRSGLIKPPKKGKSPQQHVAGRSNRAIFLRLRPTSGDGSSFVVGVYHMPCIYWDARVMTVHISLVVEALQAFAASSPMVLLGDFNVTPDSESYKLVTTGTLDQTALVRYAHLYGYTVTVWLFDCGWKLRCWWFRTRSSDTFSPTGDQTSPGHCRARASSLCRLVFRSHLIIFVLDVVTPWLTHFLDALGNQRTFNAQSAHAVVHWQPVFCCW